MERSSPLELSRPSTTFGNISNYGLPRPLKMMSGNGSLLLFPIALPYNEDNYAMMDSLGSTLARLFGDDDCDIDTAVVKDPSRILGVVGTINRSKAEVAAENRFNKERMVIGDYPNNNPLNEQDFRTAISNLLVEHRPIDTKSIMDEVDVATAPTVPAAASTATVKEIVDNIDGEQRMRRARAYIDTLPKAIDGQGGHNATMRAACECYRFGLSDIQAQNLMAYFNKTKCEPSWTDLEIQHKLQDARKAVADKGDIGIRLSDNVDIDDEPSVANVEYPLTDIGNAEHFAKVNGDNLRFVVAWRAWMLFDGRRWARDETDKVRRVAMRFVRKTMLDCIKGIKDNEHRQRYLKWASQCQSQNKVEAMLSLASSILACSPNEFDNNLNLFNLANGTLELDTLLFRQHRRSDMLMKISEVEYDPTATAPIWDAFISRIYQDGEGKPRVEVVGYVQRAVGYSLTADVSARCFFVLFGLGENGKTTFVNAVKFVMGEYAKNGLQSLLLKLGDKTVNRNTDDEADLFGSRLVAVSETDEGVRLDEAKVKRLVDTDRIKVMRKFEHPFEFEPSHKLWLSCNHKPKVKGNDEGIWRRIKLVPFLVQIPSNERDEHLLDKLKAEASGILNWMLSGLKLWQADGRKLNEPSEVSQAVGAYRTDSDTFGSFLADCIEPNDADKVSVSAAYANYCSWTDDNGSPFKLTKIEFGKRMAERGYATKPFHGVRKFVGCSIKDVVYKDDATVDATDDRLF